MDSQIEKFQKFSNKYILINILGISFMIYPLASAFLSGIIMYNLGKKDAQRWHNQQSLKSLSTSSNKQKNIEEIQVPKLPTLQEIKQKYQIKRDSFATSTVQPIIRTFYLNPSCIIHYSTLHRAPLAVHELITKPMIEGDAPRAKNFFPDPTLSQRQNDKNFIVDNDYFLKTKAWKNFGLNRGHMGAAGNYNFDPQFKKTTFSFANIVPQNGENNGGIWNTFERYSRSLLSRSLCDSIQIVSGPIYHSNTPHPKNLPQVYEDKTLILKEDGIMVPPLLYKIIKCNKNSSQYVSAFMFPNSQTKDQSHDNDRKLSEFETTLEKVSTKTGLNFYFGQSTEDLAKIDNEGLNKTKREVDEPFYRGLISNATKIGQINQGIMRAHKQWIRIDPKEYHEKILELAQKQINEINQSENSNCQKLSKELSLHKKLWHLKLDHPLMEQIQDSVYEKIIPCRYSEDQEYIRKIAERVQRQPRRYKYPHNLFMKRVFSTWRAEKKPEQ